MMALRKHNNPGKTLEHLPRVLGLL